MTDWPIRPARPGDAPAALAMLHAAHAWNLANGFNFTAATMRLEELQARMRPETFFVAERDGRVVGTVEVHPDREPGTWSLHLLGVDPASEGQGVGRALVAFAEAHARSQGAARLRLDTPATHPWLPAFYQRQGYVQAGTVQWEGKQYRSLFLTKELEPRLSDPHAAAKAFLEREFPATPVAFVAGSVIRGEGTATSDLDVVVVDPTLPGAYRESFRAFGWPFEVFVHTPETLKTFYQGDIERRRPSLPTMVAEGWVARDENGLAFPLQAEARALLAAGPAPWTPEELERARYVVTDLLDDLEGSTRREETLLIAGALVEAAVDLVLGSGRHWAGAGKWTMRALRRVDASRADALAAAMERVYRDDDQEALVHWVEDALEAVGGRLFAGYSRGKPAHEKGAP